MQNVTPPDLRGSVVSLNTNVQQIDNENSEYDNESKDSYFRESDSNSQSDKDKDIKQINSGSNPNKVFEIQNNTDPDSILP